MTRPSAPERQRPENRDPSIAGSRRPRGAGARWRAFARRYGWRAYALPLLAVVSVLAIFNAGAHRDRNAAGDGVQTAAGLLSTLATTPSVRTRPPTATSQAPGRKAGTSAPKRSVSPLALPPGPQYVTAGTGTFTIVPGTSGVIGKGQLYRFTIEVEDGVTGVDPKAFAVSVMSSLSDHRSWTGTGVDALQRVDSGPVDFRVSLVSSMSVRNLCGYSLPVETSCYDGGQARVVLNVARWVRGARVYAGDLATYRIYAVNHEVGHALGHNHSHSCLKNGMAPAMMQQTIGATTATGQVCKPNPWPYPIGATDAPGAEQVGDQADDDFFRRNSS